MWKNEKILGSEKSTFFHKKKKKIIDLTCSVNDSKKLKLFIFIIDWQNAELEFL